MRLNFPGGLGVEDETQLRLGFGQGCVLISIADTKHKLFAGVVLAPEDIKELIETLEYLRKAAGDAAGTVAS